MNRAWRTLWVLLNSSHFSLSFKVCVCVGVTSVHWNLYRFMWQATLLWLGVRRQAHVKTVKCHHVSFLSDLMSVSFNMNCVCKISKIQNWWTHSFSPSVTKEWHIFKFHVHFYLIVDWSISDTNPVTNL